MYRSDIFGQEDVVIFNNLIFVDLSTYRIPILHHFPNFQDELSAAQTMCFSLDGSRLYAGYKRMIRVWDVRRPGPQIIDIPTWSKLFYLSHS